jgi:YegS/Rv2252/BmrU family lipid kinase
MWAGTVRRMKICLVINPVAGPAWRRRSAARMESWARGVVERHAAEASVAFTEGPGHGRVLAGQAVDAGADVVVAWGGDGTINEVASALVYSRGTLGIVPVGSGNGLARELGIPRGPDDALAVALSGATRVIDAGELNGRLFFNAAGVGFDAHVAEVFASCSGHRRGFTSYAAATIRELFRYQPSVYTIEADGKPVGNTRALLISVANTRQWGNGARIAPHAVMDDERLDLVAITARPPVLILAQIWRLFMGSIDTLSHVETRQIRSATIAAQPPAAAHVDGEPLGRPGRIEVRVRAGALRVRVPLHSPSKGRRGDVSNLAGAGSPGWSTRP